ncbi:SpoIIE family protein phosphatase [candidate division KSB1 bacterium]|nr:SpoIIE family protein phosphatase [candidate division KSB1 bacterium]
MPGKNIQELEKENQHLKKTVEDLWTINQLARLISSTMPVDQILDKVVAVSVKAIKAEQGTISLLTAKKENEETGDPFKTMIRKVDVSRQVGKYRLDDHLSGWMLSNRKPLTINDVKNDNILKGVQLNEGIQSILSVPLMCKGNLIGVLNIFNKKDLGGFSNNDQRLLSIIASQSAQIIENARLYVEEKQLRRYENELEMARNIQEGLIPKEVPKTKKLDISSFFNPADEVGGDYFDYLDLGNDKVGIVMADVSGHGAAAALVMTMMKGIVHAITSDFESPEKALAEFNAILNQIGPKEKFVTMIFLVFDLKQMKLLYSSAGHPPLVFYNSKSKTCELVEFICPALGISSLSQYKQKQMTLSSGDLILIYTDGVTEAFNEEQEMFEETRLLKTVQEVAKQTSAKTIEHIKKKLKEFTEDASQSDDVAMIAIKAN